MKFALISVKMHFGRTHRPPIATTIEYSDQVSRLYENAERPWWPRAVGMLTYTYLLQLIVFYGVLWLLR